MPEREDRQLERRRDRVGEIGGDRVTRAQRVLEVAVQQTLHVVEVLHREGVVVPEPMAFRLDERRLRVRAEFHAHRIGRGVALQAEDHEGEHEQHGDHSEQPADVEAGAVHQCSFTGRP